MEQKFYSCKHCGKIVTTITESLDNVSCCGDYRQEIIPGTTEASTEKHIPVYKVENNKVYVNIGSVEHPMLPEHYIEWVSLKTNKGNQLKYLKAGDKPEACFAILDDEKVEAVYAYCNLHSLWKN